MLHKVFAAILLTLLMSAVADAQFTLVRGYVIAPGHKHTDDIEVLLTYKDGVDIIGHANVSIAGEFMFTNVNLSQGPFDVVVRVDGFREFRGRIYNPPGLGKDLVLVGGNIILIPDPRSQAVADEYAAYSTELLDEYSKGLDEISAKHPDLAVTHLEKVAMGVPDFYDVHVTLGLVYQELSRKSEAQREFRMAHELNMDSARPLVLLGRLLVEETEEEILADKGRSSVSIKLAQAREVLEQALMLDEKSAAGFYYMGVVDYRSASYGTAEKELKQALELDPALFAARITLVNVYAEQKQWQSALDSLDAFILGYPKSPYRAEALATRLSVVRRIQASQR